MSQAYFAFVRNLRTSGGGNLKNFAQILSAQTHARRQDLTSKERQDEDRSHKANHFWSKAGTGLDGGGADYVAAYRQHKKDHGVKTERKGAALAQHLLVGVSPEWLAEGGDPRDLKNERVQKLIAEAKIWAENWMGEGAVWAVRYDTDEKGAGIVDILASPIREQKHKSGSSKPSISVAKANGELAKKHGVMKGWEAMQTDWAQHAQATLDQKLQRGTPKAETRRKHLFPEEFKEVLAAAKDFGEFKEKADEMARDLVRQNREADAKMEAAQMAERTATENRREQERLARKAKAEAERAEQKKKSAESDATQARDEVRKAQDEVAQLEPQRKILADLNTEIAQRRTTLEALKKQGEKIIENAKTEARRAAQTIVDAWPEFKAVPEPFRQAANNVIALREAISETLQQLGIANKRPDLGERDPEGDPPPVLDLIFKRADHKARQKNELVNTNTPGMGR